MREDQDGDDDCEVILLGDASTCSTRSKSLESLLTSKPASGRRLALEVEPNKLAYARVVRPGEGPDCLENGIGAYSRRKLLMGERIPFCGKLTKDGLAGYAFALDDLLDGERLDLNPNFFCVGTQVRCD